MYSQEPCYKSWSLNSQGGITYTFLFLHQWATALNHLEDQKVTDGNWASWMSIKLA